jgi:NADPH-dependent curcumin reductase CurA
MTKEEDFARGGPLFLTKGAKPHDDISEWIRTGRLKYREDVVEGLENAPAAFLGVLRGKNFGKLLVEVNRARRA